MRKATFPVLIVLLVWFTSFAALAEDQGDLREGVTGAQPDELKWNWLVLVKSDPRTGFGAGVKLKGQNLFGTRMILDFYNMYSDPNDQTYQMFLVAPRLRAQENSWFYAIAFMEYAAISDYRFFGIGNRTDNGTRFTGPHDFGGSLDDSSYQYRNLRARVTLGWHPANNLYIAIEPFFREVWLDDTGASDIPSGLVKYAGMPGSDGGMTPGIALSIIQGTRDDQWRPTKGHRLEFRFEDVANYTGADFDFSRYALDYRYYRLLFGRYNVLALHFRGETLEGNDWEIPWWELPSLGGANTLRGFWENRFTGKSSLLINTEFRYHIYHLKLDGKIIKADVNMDGVLFYDMGQVFANEEEFGETLALKLNQTMGLGFRFLLPPNVLARLDFAKAGEEDKYMILFNFGTVF